MDKIYVHFSVCSVILYQSLPGFNDKEQMTNRMMI
jgi:hypothetical protein